LFDDEGHLDAPRHPLDRECTENFAFSRILPQTALTRGEWCGKIVKPHVMGLEAPLERA
jgi:hypothetical protein